MTDVVAGMASVHKFIFKHAAKRILNHGDLKDWHRKVFENVVPKNYYAGNFRSKDPIRPCLATSIFVQPNEGAPFEDVPRLMEEFSVELSSHTKEADRFIKARAGPIDRARAALQLATFASGKIIQIHPFINGNGRISRLAANFFLHRYGYPLLFDPSYPRPTNPSYAIAAEACMRRVPDFSLMYQYLLICLAGRP